MRKVEKLNIISSVSLTYMDLVYRCHFSFDVSLELLCIIVDVVMKVLYLSVAGLIISLCVCQEFLATITH